jgi:hypothetical protein
MIAKTESTNHPAPKAPNDQREASNSLLGYLGLGLTIVIAVAACIQAAVAIWQAIIYKRQYDVMSQALVASNQSAEAALKGVAALEKLERPFLMIEVRSTKIINLRTGQEAQRIHNQVWAVNKGKIPAQIIWINPVGTVLYPRGDADLAQTSNYNYGIGYYEKDAEVINVEWIAPDAEREIASFNYTALHELPEDIKGAIQRGERWICFMSAMKYRGMLNDTIFESRWCFRWGGEEHGLRLAGPYGYNKYT